MVFRIVRYCSDDREVWNAFVSRARNSTFLFLRDYMDYHADRFTDHSLMVWADDRLVALLPANVADNTLYSHAGLTYGGLVTGFGMQGATVLHIFEALVQYGRESGLSGLYYKPVPTIYHKAPAQDDEYALWCCGAQPYSCSLASAVGTGCAETVTARRKREYCRQLERKGYSVRTDTPLHGYWPMLESCLKERYNAVPVHSLQEMTMLQERFPDRIRCFTVHDCEGKLMGGLLLFLMDRVLRMQYSCSCEEGMESGAMTLLFERVLDFCRSDGFAYFDMGTSNGLPGNALNESLEYWKWSFGGRGVAFKTYYLRF